MLFPTSKKLGFYSVLHFLAKKKKVHGGPKRNFPAVGTKTSTKKANHHLVRVWLVLRVRASQFPAFNSDFLKSKNRCFSRFLQRFLNSSKTPRLAVVFWRSIWSYDSQSICRKWSKNAKKKQGKRPKNTFSQAPETGKTEKNHLY